MWPPHSASITEEKRLQHTQSQTIASYYNREQSFRGSSNYQPYTYTKTLLRLCYNYIGLDSQYTSSCLLEGSQSSALQSVIGEKRRRRRRPELVSRANSCLTTCLVSLGQKVKFQQGSTKTVPNHWQYIGVLLQYIGFYPTSIGFYYIIFILQGFCVLCNIDQGSKNNNNNIILIVLRSSCLLSYIII